MKRTSAPARQASLRCSVACASGKRAPMKSRCTRRRPVMLRGPRDHVSDPIEEARRGASSLRASGNRARARPHRGAAVLYGFPRFDVSVQVCQIRKSSPAEMRTGRRRSRRATGSRSTIGNSWRSPVPMQRFVAITRWLRILAEGTARMPLESLRRRASLIVVNDRVSTA